jgi:hypothetical protein
MTVTIAVDSDTMKASEALSFRCFLFSGVPAEDDTK